MLSDENVDDSEQASQQATDAGIGSEPAKTADRAPQESAGKAADALRSAFGAARGLVEKTLLPGVRPASASRTGFPAMAPIEPVRPIEPEDFASTMEGTVEPILSSIRRHDWTNVGVVGKRLDGELGQDGTGRSVISEEQVDGSARGIHSVYYDYARFREQALIRSVAPLGIPAGKPGTVAGQYGLHQDGRGMPLRAHAAGTVFIAHGYTGSWQKFDEVAWYMLRAGFNVLIIEHRGHGGSLRETSDPDLVRMRDWHNYVSDFLAAAEHGRKRFGFARPYLLIGHSMGGGIAAAIIEQHPAFFDRAVLTSPMLTPSTPIPADTVLAAADLVVHTGHGADTVPGMDDYDTYSTKLLDHKAATGLYEDGSNAALDARTGWYAAHRTPDLRRHTIRPSWDWLDSALRMDHAVLKKGAIARITTPTIVFNGGKDTMVRPDAEGLFVTRARRASAPVRFYHFDDGHHELFSETPEITTRYYTTILSFFLGASQEG